MPRRRRALASLLALSLAAACGPATVASHAYDGPYPSAAAVAALRGLAGSELRASGLGPAGGALVVERFDVLQNPVTGHGPVVTLIEAGRAPAPLDPAASGSAAQGAGGRWFLPVLTNGDAADLVVRVTGAAPAFGGPLSAAYDRAIGAAPR